jgi:hypothetical protein
MLLAVLILLLAYGVMRYIAGTQHITVQISNWKYYVHDIFYVLNEEIVLGAILLYWMVNRVGFRPFISAIVLSIIFSLLHFMFYKWIFLDRGTLQLKTLTSLFLIGYIRNSLILLTGNIGYSWALHFGWMAVMFGSHHFYADSGEVLYELQRFDIYLGSGLMLLTALFLAGLISVFWFVDKKARNLYAG